MQKTAIDAPFGAMQAGEDQAGLPVRRVADASVILCAYTENRWQDLVEAIQSIREQTVLPREVILVIDHNPALFARAAQAFPDVSVRENRQPRGLSGARNTAIDQAQGEILAFMDEDALADPDWLERLLDHYQDRAVRGVGGSIEPLWLQSKPGWFPEEFNWVVGCTYRGMPVETAPVRNLIGANMSFRRQVFETAGGFTNGMGRIGTLPVGCEETELCIRAAQKTPGATFLFEPRARVRHRVPGPRGTWRYFVSRCFAEGISKAQVARLVGAQHGLSNERAYTLRTLPSGILAGLQDTAFRGDSNGLRRSAAILAGLLVTTLGYLRGKVSHA